MKRMSIILVVIFLCINGLVSCNHIANNGLESKNGILFPILTTMSDSLLTVEQRKLKDKLRYVFYRNITVCGNHLIFTLSKDSFLNLDLPVIYYDMVIRDINNMNNYTDTTGIDFIQSFLESKKEYFDSLDSSYH